MIGKSNTKPPITLDPIQLSSDHESPKKKLREDSAEESKPAKETKSEPVMPSLSQKAIVTPSSQIPKPSIKCDMPSTSTEKPKHSPIEQSGQSPTIEQLQKEILQEKVNSLQRLVDQMTTTNHKFKNAVEASKEA
jgi:hypothetical protein